MFLSLCLHQIGLFRFSLFLFCIVCSCIVVFIKNMNNHHAAFWSASLSPEENPYRITHHNRTKRRGNRQQQKQQQEKEQRQQQQEQQQRGQDFGTWEQNLDYTTWEEIDRWAVDPGRVLEPVWDSLEQCEEGYRRMELEKRARRRGRKPESQPQKCLGGGTQEVWRSQVGDLRQLPVLTGGRERSGRHRVMLWSSRCPQCGCIARCGTYQLCVSAELEWASSQVP